MTELEVAVRTARRSSAVGGINAAEWSGHCVWRKGDRLQPTRKEVALATIVVDASCDRDGALCIGAIRLAVETAAGDRLRDPA